MAKRTFPLKRVYQLLEPGPVLLLTTEQDGRANVMTMSWHTMMEFEPPLVGCVVSARNHSFTALRETGQCVLNIPTIDLAPMVVACGNNSGRDLDKFERYGLARQTATKVAPPLLTDCYASLECKVKDMDMVERYNFFVLQVVKAWIDPAHKDPRTLHHRGYGSFMMAGTTMALPSDMP
ncbi:flavin reductase [Janthinobacterium sp. BJB412]|nr:flavin reductase [Janthinobacterium sp. BJB412]